MRARMRSARTLYESVMMASGMPEMDKGALTDAMARSGACRDSARARPTQRSAPQLGRARSVEEVSAPDSARITRPTATARTSQAPARRLGGFAQAAAVVPR
jgi:hypothetical protein